MHSTGRIGHEFYILETFQRWDYENQEENLGGNRFLVKASPSLLRVPGEVGSGLSILTTEISIQTRRKVL